ncbi:MAG: tripartite tricarboxylate transporter substrate binding protein, partial [Burkholderiales bacterium]
MNIPHTTIMAAATLVAAAHGVAGAAQAYPTRPIRIVVAYTPAGATDILARVIGQKMNEAWGQPVIIENRPGAN